MDSLRRAVSDGTRQLGAQSKTLGQQWQRGLGLAASVGLLEQIQGVVEVPARVEEAVACKVWGCGVCVCERVVGVARCGGGKILEVCVGGGGEGGASCGRVRW